MACHRLFYGVNGEGLGHISRALAVIEHLPSSCETHIFTYGKAYEYMLRQNYPYLHKIEGMMFSFMRGKVDYWKTTKDALWFMMTSKNHLSILESARELTPSLMISDFEPSIARIARKLRVPLLSIDSQHRFAHSDFPDLPFHLRAYGWGCGLFAKWMVPEPDQVLISTFHYDRIRSKCSSTIPVNGLFRKAIEEAVPKRSDFVLVYTRESISQQLLRILMETRNVRYRIYGVQRAISSQYSDFTRFEFRDLGTHFAEDLANSRCLVGSAGNQLISEARFLGRPILAIPEPRQYEQHINAFYVSELGLGRGMDLHLLTPSIVQDFVDQACWTKAHVPNGVHKVIEVIDSYINSNQKRKNSSPL